jgi:hypothetical protein
VSHPTTLTIGRRARLSPIRRSVVVLMTTTLVTCCASTTSQQSSDHTATESADASPPTTHQQESVMCTEESRAQLQDRISMQIESLRSGEFEQAREYASSSFQGSVTVSAFREMIESGFPFLLESQPVAFGRCRITDGTATVEVRFGRASVVTLVYFLTQSDETWWIDGASPAVDTLADKLEAS